MGLLRELDQKARVQIQPSIQWVWMPRGPDPWRKLGACTKAYFTLVFHSSQLLSTQHWRETTVLEASGHCSELSRVCDCGCSNDFSFVESLFSSRRKDRRDEVISQGKKFYSPLDTSRKQSALTRTRVSAILQTYSSGSTQKGPIH